MTSTPENAVNPENLETAANAEHPVLDGSDLAELRHEIDDLKAIPEEDLISPVPTASGERELEAEPTDAPGTEDWDDPDPASPVDDRP